MEGLSRLVPGISSELSQFLQKVWWRGLAHAIHDGGGKDLPGRRATASDLTANSTSLLFSYIGVVVIKTLVTQRCRGNHIALFWHAMLNGYGMSEANGTVPTRAPCTAHAGAGAETSSSEAHNA